MTRDEFVAANPIAAVFREQGITVPDSGQVMVKCPFHADKTPSLSVDLDKGLWNCFAGCGSGSVIDLIAKFRSTTAADVLRSLPKDSNPAPRRAAKPTQQISAIYSYTDALGREVFQVVRMVPKTFRQRQMVDGEWVWSMDGVERVLFNLPAVLKADQVWVVEGEKDAETLAGLGFTATCNVGGAGKWLEGYSESLRGKQVILCGDNDDAGRKHIELVFESLAGKAKEVRQITPPAGKDVSDSVSELGQELARQRLEALVADAVPFVRGIRLPVFHVGELEAKYSEHVKRLGQDGIDLGKWLPSLHGRVRHLVPGDLCMVLGGTGVGKTAVLSNIALSAAPVPTLLFELELPAEVLFERLIALRSKMDCRDVETAYSTGDMHGQEWMAKAFPGLYICTEARLNTDAILRLIERSELKIGHRPKLVLLDYVGLIDGPGSSRYDRFSNIAEALKVTAKATGTVIVCAVQISRKAADESDEVRLTDGKDSGSIENSAGLVLGCWRPAHDRLMVKVLKNTKGSSGHVIECNYDGPKLRITERSPISDQDVPYRPGK